MLFSIFLYNNRFGNKTVNNNKESGKINLLSDYSRFFTVNSCIYKYISYLQSKYTDSLMKVIDVNYIINNNIYKITVLLYKYNCRISKSKEFI